MLRNRLAIAPGLLTNLATGKRSWGVMAMGAALGLGLPIIGKLLGYSQPATKQRYANLAPDPVAAANERIGEALLAAMEKGKAQVVEIGKTYWGP